MALQEIDAICRQCHESFRQQPKRTFLGFQRLKCPRCSREVVYPLTPGYRATYWILVGLMALVTIGSLAQGQVAFPGLLGLAVIWGLIEDSRLRKDVAKAEAGARAAPTARP